MLRRLPLASLVCPTAPFLAPRLLYTPATASIAALSARCGAAPTSSQQCSYATKVTKWRMRPKKSQKERQQQGPPTIKKTSGRSSLPAGQIELANLLTRFRKACLSRDADVILDLYPTLVASKRLDRTDTRHIAQALHVHVRTKFIGQSRTPRAFPFVEQLAQDIRAGNLEPHPFAHVHLLGIYKECQMYHSGHAFWQWLVNQDDTFVDQAVYGAAIELLAYQGEASLQQLEELYVDGLKRFPGTFAEYHLSPDAIVPDRTQRTSIVGLPILLLQGILTARLLSRDWKQAYLALDTALRLYPTETPARFFDLFIRERPISEGYTVFLLACRSGVVLRPYQFTVLLAKLQKYSATFPSLQERVTILRSMANAMYAYVECGGSLEGPHIGAFLNTFGTLLPWKRPGEQYAGDEAKIRNIIITQAHAIMATLIQAGMPPQPQLFVALISLAGKFGAPELLTVTLQDISTAGTDIGSIGRRCIIAAAGFLKDKALIEYYWEQIASQGELEGSQNSHAYWITLAKACNAADHRTFFTQQVRKLQHTISVDAMRDATVHLNTSNTKKEDSTQSYTSIAPTILALEMKLLEEQIQNIATVIMSGQPLDLLQTPFYMALHPESRYLGSTEDLRAVYDELTTDPHQPAPPIPKEGASAVARPASIGIPLDELRFRNWVNIMELMDEAKATEFEFQRQLDTAMQDKKPLAPALYAKLRPVDQELAPAMTKEELKKYIRHLRAPGESISPRKGVSVQRSRPQFNPSATPESIWLNTQHGSIGPGLQPAPKLRYHVTEAPGHASPVAATDSIRHRPLGKPGLSGHLDKPNPRLRYHISLQETHNAPAPSALSRRPLQSTQSSSIAQDPLEELQQVAEQNNNNNNTDVDTMESPNSSYIPLDARTP